MLHPLHYLTFKIQEEVELTKKCIDCRYLVLLPYYFDLAKKKGFCELKRNVDLLHSDPFVTDRGPECVS